MMRQLRVCVCSAESLSRVNQLTGKPEAVEFVKVRLIYGRGALMTIYSRQQRALKPPICCGVRCGISLCTLVRAPLLLQCDIREKAEIESVFTGRKFDGVIHFAGYKAVGESRQKPMIYYTNNLKGSINLFEVMAAHGCKELVFSSSCTVYGTAPAPVSEDGPVGVGITNAYARSKFQIEECLRDLQVRPSGAAVVFRLNPRKVAAS